MTRISVIAVVIAATFASLGAQGANDLFQKALSKERVDGQLAEAIALYERVVSEAGSDRALAARALLQMARCQDRLGTGDAQKTYERILREHADQRATAGEARARLAALAAPGVPGRRDAMARRVWAGPEISPSVSVSPDGRLVAFADWASGDLAVREVTTGRTRRLAKADGTWNEWAEFSTFSPDGKHVAYGWFRGKNGRTHYELRTVAIAGGTPRVLYDNVEVQYVLPAAWMPNGTAIVALLQRHDGSAQIALISAVDGSARVLKTLNWRGPTRISVSPDGQWIAYDTAPVAGVLNGDIVLLATNGTRESVLVKHPANDLDPVWTPDGRAVVFVSDRTGSLGAWLVRVDNGGAVGAPEILKADLGRRNFPLGFAGGAYVYALQVAGTDISLVTLDPDTGKAVGSPAVVSERFVGTNNSPGWSRSSDMLAFVSDRGARYTHGRTLVIHSMASGEQQELEVPMSYFRTPAWSQDAHSVLLVGRDEKSREGLFRFDIASKRVTAIVQSEPGLYVNWAEWMPGTRDVVYSGPSGNKGGRLVRRNVDTGNERELFKSDGAVVRALSISPDGKHIVFDEHGLKLISADGGAVRDLFGTDGNGGIVGFRGLAWTRNGRYVLFPRRASSANDQQVEFWRVDVATGAAESIGLSLAGLRDFALDPSGRELAFSGGTPRFEIWALENLIPPARTPTAGRR